MLPELRGECQIRYLSNVGMLNYFLLVLSYNWLIIWSYSCPNICHVAHLNIHDELLCFKDVIAKVIYDVSFHLSLT
ncbi:hypothetical protein Godav_003772 [Gossypium davidsonii]|uniref:Uncharacterized protein n=1 Tax=Gossypium davidsonii TaxID=34287 RepID=A0A7J8SIZ2_GOSDV|nr:hypothetical protein [Gossypium davidsonii]